MKHLLRDYLRKHVRSGGGPDFTTIEYKYGKFILYAIIDSDGNIIHLTFAPAKHVSAKMRLSGLGFDVNFAPMPQRESSFYALFHDYFRGRLTRFPIVINSPFIESGTAFQKRVWQNIQTIPYGKRITYRELARMSGVPSGVRAVGTACGANPLALIIPCHRVLAINGLGGFAGGIAVKEALLQLEESWDSNLSGQAGD